MTMEHDEQAIRAFLQPLRTMPPVMRRPAAEPRRKRRWTQAAELLGVALAAVALVAAIALLGHRSRPSAPAPAHAPRHRGVLTYLFSGTVFQATPDGQTRIGPLAGAQTVRAFGWAPDGERVAYLAGDATAARPCAFEILDLRTHRATGFESWSRGSPSFPGNACAAPEAQVRWSPDGRLVAVSARQRLIVLDLANRKQGVVAVGGSPFTWWPGGRLAYLCPGQLNGAGIDWCASRPDGSGRVRLPFHGWNLTWSPAVNRVAYLRDVPRTAGGFHLQVWVARPDGAGPRRLWTDGQECCITLTPQLAWSADGSRLVVSGADAVVVDAVTGRAHRLRWWSPGVSLRAWNPSWRP